MSIFRKQIDKRFRAHLSQQYGFHCTCDVCSLPDELSKASDERLSEISRLYQEFSNWGSYKVEGAQAIDYIRKIWKMEEEEGYFSERGQLAADAAWIAASHSEYVFSGVNVKPTSYHLYTAGWLCENGRKLRGNGFHMRSGQTAVKQELWSGLRHTLNYTCRGVREAVSMLEG